VATLYFDSSALVKRFVNEPGAAWVTQCLDPASGNRIHVARITGVEVVSALTRHARHGILSALELATALAEFRREFASVYRQVPISSALIDAAMHVAEVHALRGYDAVQLAAALRILRQRRARSVSASVTLVSADAALNAAALTEGLAVDDPNNHP
jgi:predicted nucleic acid-binding protein